MAYVSVKKTYSSGDRKQHMNIVVTFSQYAAVLTKFNSIIGRKFGGGEAGVFGGKLECLVGSLQQQTVEENAHSRSSRNTAKAGV